MRAMNRASFCIRKRKHMKKFGKGCLVLIGLVILLGFIGVILGGGKSGTASDLIQPAQVTNETSALDATPQTFASTAMPAPAAFKLGEDVNVDQVRWKILEAADLGQTLKSDNQYMKDKITSGRFLLLRFEVENLSKDMLTFAGLDLLDNQGRSFTRSSDALTFIPTEEACVLENLNPNVTKTCTLIYEVPSNAAGLQAQVGDLKIIGSKHALIDLNLATKQ